MGYRWSVISDTGTEICYVYTFDVWSRRVSFGVFDWTLSLSPRNDDYLLRYYASEKSAVHAPPVPTPGQAPSDPVRTDSSSSVRGKAREVWE